MKVKKCMYGRYLIITSMVALAATFTGCSKNEKTTPMSTPQEGIEACRQELAKVKPMQTCSTEELSQLTNDWLELQDSTMNMMLRDSTFQKDKQLAEVFFNVADSFRIEVMRLAETEKRSMADVMTVRVAIADEKDRESDEREVLSNMLSNTLIEHLLKTYMRHK